MLNLLQVLSVNFLCGADFLFSHPSGFRWAAIVEYHPFAKWGCPRLGQPGRYQWSASRLHLSFLQSPGQLSAHILPLSHPPLGETFCTATQCLLSCMSLVSDREQMFGSLCVSGQSEETECEGQTQVRPGVKNCSHMMHPDQVFRTLWATSGYLRQQGTDLQGSGCGSAVTWYLVLFTWAVSFCAKWLQALGLIWRHTFCLCLLLFLFFFFFCMDLHVSRQFQLGHCSCWVVCVISKPKALSQGVLQPEVTNTKGLSETVVSSVWGQSGKNLSLLVTFKAK